MIYLSKNGIALRIIFSLCISAYIMHALNAQSSRINAGVFYTSMKGETTAHGIRFTNSVYNVENSITDCGHEKCKMYSIKTVVKNENTFRIRFWFDELTLKDTKEGYSVLAYYNLPRGKIFLEPGEEYVAIAESPYPFGSQANLNPDNHIPTAPNQISFSFSYMNMDEKDCADYRMWASDNVRLYEKGWEGYSYEKALYYYKKALEICVDYQDNIMASIREVEEKMNIGESSQVGNEQASQCNDLLEQADTYYYTGDTENALATYQKALNSGNCEQEYIAQQIDLLSGGSDDVVIETVEKEGPEMTQSGPPETEPCKCPPGEQVIEEPEWYYDENTGNYMKVGDCICEKIQKTDHAEIDVELNYCGTEMDMVISELERFYKGNISDLNIETYMAKLEKIADRLVGLECIPTDDQMARWQEVILNLAEHLNMGTELMPSLTDTKKDKRVPVIPKHDGIPEALPNPGVVIIDNSKNKNSERNVLPNTKFPKAELEPGNASLNNDEDFERRTRND